MTAKNKDELLRLIWQFDNEELDCDGDCFNCYYYVESREFNLDNCPLLIAHDMIYRKIHDITRWNKRKG